MAWAARACTLLFATVHNSTHPLGTNQSIDIYECDYVDTDGLKLMNNMRRNLRKLGIATRQYEDDVEKPGELFDNIEKLHTSIDKEDTY